ncbi:MAG: ABC transporter permease [Bacteroidales bacterium]|nr:ABC transporter permease [Bacteroidales bacterium]
MIWLISWRNVWRNKLRSLVVIIAVTLGLVAGVFTTAFMKGMSEKRISDAIENEISHIQIHQKGFVSNLDFNLCFPDAGIMLNTIQEMDQVIAASKRIVIGSMASSAEAGAGVIITGVVPSVESEVTRIHQRIIRGVYFRDYKRNHPAVIGKKLAEKLNLDLEKKMILTLTDNTGQPLQAAFKIAGIYETDNTGYDEMHVFVKFDDLVSLTGFEAGSAHEIAVRLKENNRATETAGLLRQMFPGLQISDWHETSPELAYLSSMMDQYMYIFVLIILLALCFGIINTMLMAVLERVKELGMLMAVGMSKSRIFSMIMLESVFLSITGGLTGIISGYFLSKYYQHHDIPLPVQYAEGLRDIGYSPVVNTPVDLKMILVIALLVLVTGLFSSVFPAYKALKLNPADAIRSDN